MNEETLAFLKRLSAQGPATASQDPLVRQIALEILAKNPASRNLISYLHRIGYDPQDKDWKSRELTLLRALKSGRLPETREERAELERLLVTDRHEAIRKAISKLLGLEEPRLKNETGLDPDEASLTDPAPGPIREYLKLAERKDRAFESAEEKADYLNRFGQELAALFQDFKIDYRVSKNSEGEEIFVLYAAQETLGAFPAFRAVHASIARHPELEHLEIELNPARAFRPGSTGTGPSARIRWEQMRLELDFSVLAAREYDFAAIDLYSTLSRSRSELLRIAREEAPFHGTLQEPGKAPVPISGILAERTSLRWLLERLHSQLDSGKSRTQVLTALYETVDRGMRQIRRIREATEQLDRARRANDVRLTIELDPKTRLNQLVRFRTGPQAIQIEIPLIESRPGESRTEALEKLSQHLNLMLGMSSANDALFQEARELCIHLKKTESVYEAAELIETFMSTHPGLITP